MNEMFRARLADYMFVLIINIFRVAQFDDAVLPCSKHRGIDLAR